MLSVSNFYLSYFVRSNSHAVRMVKFARDAQLRMTRLLDELQRTAGKTESVSSKVKVEGSYTQRVPGAK